MKVNKLRWFISHYLDLDFKNICGSHEKIISYNSVFGDTLYFIVYYYPNALLQSIIGPLIPTLQSAVQHIPLSTYVTLSFHWLLCSAPKPVLHINRLSTKYFTNSKAFAITISYISDEGLTYIFYLLCNTMQIFLNNNFGTPC